MQTRPTKLKYDNDLEGGYGVLGGKQGNFLCPFLSVMFS